MSKVLSLLLLVCVGVNHCAQIGRAQQFEEMLNQKITLEPEKLPVLSTDDALLALARESHLNVLADATHFETTPQQDVTWTAYERSPLLRNFLYNLATHRSASWLQHDARTLLFWRQPPFEEIVRRIVAGEDTRVPVPTLKPEEATDLWQNYLQQLPNRPTDKEAVTVRVGSLPSPLREYVRSQIQEHWLRPEVLDFDKMPFNDDFWQTASVSLRRLGAPDAPERLVLITQTPTAVRYSSLDAGIIPPTRKP